MNKQRGFSLMELMVAVAIVGILAAVAIPSYQSHLVKGNRAVTQAFMMDVINREKQYQLDARSYTNDLAVLFGVPASTAAVPADVIRHYGNIVISVSSPPPTVVITATPTSSNQASDGWISLSSDGTRSSQYSNKW